MKAETADPHAEPLHSALWRAGAGAGKTYNLVKRVMRIAETYQRDGKVPRLVVTTFTRKATQELRERLMEEALSRAMGVGGVAGDSSFVPFVTSRGSLFVTTMHGVMDRFLRAYGSHIGLEPGFRVATGEEVEALARRVGKSLLFRGQAGAVADSLLGEFDFSQTLRLLRELARVRLEFPTARPPTAAETRASLLGEFANRAVAIQALRREIESKSQSAKWNETTEWLGVLVSSLQTLPEEPVTGPSPFVLLQELLLGKPKITNSGAHKIDFDDLKNWGKPLKELEADVEGAALEWESADDFARFNQALLAIESEFAERLRQEKLRLGLLEIEDLELFALDLVRRHPEAAKAFSDDWDHWLIDEYQDTSPRQVQLLEALAEGKPQFIVGDPQQSVYLFRGARPHVFFAREKAALAAKHETVNLDGNRRSSAAIMDFINGASAKLGAEFRPMTAERANQPDGGRRADSIASPFAAVTFLALKPQLGNDGKKRNIAEQRRREAELLATAVQTVWRAGASPGSMAVLARTNKELGILAKALARAGVPLQVHTSGAYADRLEIADLCALLLFLANPHDDENLIHLARTPWFPIDESRLAQGYRRKGSLWSVLDAGAGESQLEVETLQACLLAAKERGIVQAFREALLAADFYSWCGVLDPSGRREANVLKFLIRLATAERQAGFVPRKFVDEILGGGDRGGENDSSDRDAVAAVKPDRVSIMTVHASKGLEFDHIFLPFLNQKPSLRAASADFVFHEQEQRWSVGLPIGEAAAKTTGSIGRRWRDVLRAWSKAEDARVLYVALTRARESLFLSATGDEPEGGSFLDALGLELAQGTYRLGTAGNYSVCAESDLDGAARTPAESANPVSVRVPFGQLAEAERLWREDPMAMASISVTRLLELEDELEIALGRDTGKAKATAARAKEAALSGAQLAARGTRLHRVFELAKPSGRGGANPDLLAAEIARWFPLHEQAEASSALRWILTLQEPNLGAVLASGAAEWGFTYVRPLLNTGSEPGAAINLAVDGQIDLWGRDLQERLWVIDYKTGDSRYKDKAFRQLRYYAEALLAGGRAKLGETVWLAALYPYSREVFTESLVLTSLPVPSSTAVR